MVHQPPARRRRGGRDRGDGPALLPHEGRDDGPCARRRERVEQRLAADPASQDGSSRRRVAALLEQLLPLDEERTLEAHVGLAFQAYAAVKPEIAADLRADTAGMREGVARWIADVGKVDDPPSAAAGLLSLVEGLALHVLGRHLTAEEARTALHAQLDLLF